MEIEVLNDHKSIYALKEKWQDLYESSSNCKFYLSYEWVISGYETFHKNDIWNLVVIYDSEKKLLGIAPLVISKGKYRYFKVKKIGFLNNAQNPANDFLLRQGEEESCLSRFISYLIEFPAWGLIDLKKIAKDTITEKFLETHFDRTVCHVAINENIKSPFIDINCSWDFFWSKKSKKFQKVMRNKLNKISNKDYDCKFKTIPLLNTKDKNFDNIIDISSKSWKAGIGTDLKSRKDNWEFYNKITDLLGPQKKIILYILEINSKAVAFEYHIQCNSTTYPIRADYDSSYKALSPGSVLEYEIIKQIFENKKIKKYNSCGHTYDYLLNWSEEVKEHVNYEIFKHSIYYRLIFITEYKIKPILEKLKKNRNDKV